MASNAVMSRMASTWLSDPSTMPAIPGLRVPDEFYWIKTGTAPLAGMPLPGSRTPWARLSKLGFSKVVCLSNTRPIYDPAPLQLAAAVEMDDLCDGGEPLNPRSEALRYQSLADRVRKWLARSEGVIVHCAGGRGRTGTLIGAILVMEGFPAAHVTKLLDKIHQERGKPGWPESRWQKRLLVEMERSSVGRGPTIT